VRVHFDGWTLDSDARELRRGDEPVHLPPKNFHVLETLVVHCPAAVSTDRLFEIVWPNIAVDPGSLTTVVKEVRRVLGDNAHQPKYIQTVHAFGYKFIAPVVVEEEPKATVKTVAVFPFTNFSGHEFDYISDGIADGLFNALSRLGSLRVRPRTTSFRYRGADVDVQKAAREMGVEAIVTGRVQVREGQVTVQVELINTKTDSHIWGDRFHARASELLDLQNRIVSEVLPRIAEQAGATVAAAPTKNADAYEFFLKGQHWAMLRDTDGARRSIEALTIATELDPNFALAHAALAEVQASLGSREVDPPRDIFPKAKASARRALSINASIAAAHTALAAVHELFERDWPAAENAHRTAVKNEPRYASAQHWFALHWARRGEQTEAKRWIDSAMKLEPLSPIIHTNAALIAYLAHDYKSALALGLTALELAPHFEGAHMIRGVAYIQIPDPSRAIDELEEAARLSKRAPYSMMHLASAYSAAGDAFAARRIRDEVRALAEHRFVSSSVIAMLEIAVGNLNAAIDAFEEAASQRSPWVSYFRCEPRLDVLRSQPRFQSLIDSIGFGSAPTLNP
jgi:TolB-like protein/Flp pilus assembly protein TadD